MPAQTKRMKKLVVTDENYVLIPNFSYKKPKSGEKSVRRILMFMNLTMFSFFLFF